MTTRLILAEHHTLIREGIKQMLQGVNDIAIVAEVGQVDTAQRALRESHPEVMLLDIGFPPPGGLESATRFMRAHPDLKIIGLGPTAQGPFPARFLDLGAHGFLTHGCDPDELVTAIRRVAADDIYIGADVAQRMVMNRIAGGTAAMSSLSARELSVLVMVSKGLRPKEISSSLCISPKTVSTYRSRVCRKLGVKTDVELTHLSLRHGLIEALA